MDTESDITLKREQNIGWFPVMAVVLIDFYIRQVNAVNGGDTVMLAVRL